MGVAAAWVAERGAGADAGEELRAREQAGAGAEAAAGAHAGAAAAAGGHLVPEPPRAVEDEEAGDQISSPLGPEDARGRLLPDDPAEQDVGVGLAPGLVFMGRSANVGCARSSPGFVYRDLKCFA